MLSKTTLNLQHPFASKSMVASWQPLKWIWNGFYLISSLRMTPMFDNDFLRQTRYDYEEWEECQYNHQSIVYQLRLSLCVNWHPRLCQSRDIICQSRYCLCQSRHRHISIPTHTYFNSDADVWIATPLISITTASISIAHLLCETWYQYYMSIIIRKMYHHKILREIWTHISDINISALYLS